MTTGALLIYGATGYTGKLIARAARGRGIVAVLGGRDEARLRILAAELGTEFCTARLDQPETLDGALRGVCAVINAASPFAASAPALVAACLRTGVHYLDVTGEVALIDVARRRGDEARRSKIMVMPAVGFDVVSSDCLAAHVARRAGRPKRLFIGLSGLELLSRGSARTMIDQLGDPAWVRRDGVLVRVPAGSLERVFDYGAGPRQSVVASWADVATAYFTTGVGDITVYFEATTAVRAHHSMLKIFGPAIPFTPWQALLRGATQWMPDGPSEEERANRHAVVVVSAENDDGKVVSSRLRTPEVYSFTALAGAAVAERVLVGDLEPGFQTPGRVYGPELVTSLPGVHLEDLSHDPLEVG